MRSKKYILWDHDGVLVDTEFWYYEATCKALAELGIGVYGMRAGDGNSDGGIDAIDFNTVWLPNNGKSIGFQN